MKKHDIWLSAAVLSLFWWGAASATTYISATGKTSLNLSEEGNNPRGFY